MEQESVINGIQNMIQLRADSAQILFNCKFKVPYHMVKKNNRPIFRGRIGKSMRLRVVEKYMEIEFKKALSLYDLNEPIKKPVWCIFHFYFNDFYVKAKKKSEPDRMSLTLGDLSGLYELPQDCMQKAGIIKNDALICSHDLSRKLPSPDEHNYLEVFVIDFNNAV